MADATRQVTAIAVAESRSNHRWQRDGQRQDWFCTHALCQARRLAPGGYEVGGTFMRARPDCPAEAPKRAGHQDPILCRCCGLALRSREEIGGKLLRLSKTSVGVDDGQDAATLIYVRHKALELSRELVGYCQSCSLVPPHDGPAVLGEVPGALCRSAPTITAAAVERAKQ